MIKASSRSPLIVLFYSLYSASCSIKSPSLNFPKKISIKHICTQANCYKVFLIRPGRIRQLIRIRTLRHIGLKKHQVRDFLDFYILSIDTELRL